MCSVKGRLHTTEGIDLASFLYQSIQAYDFYHLHDHYECQLQIGGSDQWGNITAGIDLIEKRSPQSKCRPLHSSSNVIVKPFGLTVPLLLSPTGEKFGKSAGNALFLSPKLTHPFDLYQVFHHALFPILIKYLLRTMDEHASQYLRIFTLLPLPQIDEIIVQHRQAPEKRLAQRVLAEELVSMIHGVEVAERCVFQTAVLYPAKSAGATGYNVSSVVRAFTGDERMFKQISRNAFLGKSISRLLKDLEIVPSYGIPRNTLGSTVRWGLMVTNFGGRRRI